MCNAYSLTLPRSALYELGSRLAEQLDLELAAFELSEDLAPRYRYSPRQWAPVLRLDDKGRLRLEVALWGFLISGGKPGFAPTNARFDKLSEGWPWKLVSGDQRCLVPADGFFEPEKRAGDKKVVPWSYYTLGNRQPFWMAGLYNAGLHPKTGAKVISYTIVTTDANAAIRIHNRMPVMIEDDHAGEWLRPGAVPVAASEPFPAGRMTGWRVADEARNSRLPDTESMIAPLAQNSLFD